MSFELTPKTLAYCQTLPILAIIGKWIEKQNSPLLRHIIAKLFIK